MAYADLSTIQTTDPGDPLTAAWCDQVRDNDEFFRDPPACSVYGGSAQSIAHNSLTVIAADSELFDNDSMHSTVSNTSRITCQTGGRYLLGTTVFFASNSTGSRFIEFYVNGTDRYNAMQTINAGSPETILTGVRALVLAGGDYVEVRARQASGVALDVTLNEFVAVLLTLT